jgi:hypothetical protein
MSERKPFDPSKYLINLGGKEYLEVKHRLIWFRQEQPGGSIQTEAVHILPDDVGEKRAMAIFKATVTREDGGVGTGWGSETAADFEDFIEKAETKAIGRALAAAGFGTQFSGEHAMLNPDGSPHLVDAPAERNNVGQMRMVDAPVDLAAKPRTKRQERAALEAEAKAMNDPLMERATERQVRFIHAIAREAGFDEQELATWSQELYGRDVEQLNRRDASTLIEALQRRRNEVS